MYEVLTHNICVKLSQVFHSCLIYSLFHPGQQKWQQSFNSPVISIYDFEGGSLRKLHAVTVASEMLSSLTVSSVLAIQADISSIRASDSALQ